MTATRMLLIRVDHPPGGDQLAVRAFTVEAEGGSWSEHLGCEKLYPRDQRVLEQARAAALATGDPELSASQAGRKLWDLLLADTVHGWWRTEVERSDDAVVRTVLDVRAAELRGVPWELLSRGDGGPPFRSDRHPWVRATQTPLQPLEPLSVPVGVLVVVGEPSSTDLEVDDELAAIHEAYRGIPGRWSVEVLQAPETKTRLEEVWRDVQPDVLHFIGHGTRLDGESVLAFEGALGRWPWRPNEVDELPDPAPRLVVLNACRTADPANGSQASWDFTEAFIRRGSAAVVAMQGDIRSAGAVEFSRALYSALADGKPVDVAAALGRRAIDARLRVDQDDRCWALPCLSVAAHPDQVLPIRVEPGDLDRFSRPPISVHAQRLTGYVNQTRERRLFWRAVDPLPGKTCRNPLTVTGGPGFGKSAMVISALLTLRLRGRNVVYVDLAEAKGQLKKRISWLAVLRAIRDAMWNNWLPDAPDEPRRQFDHRLSFFKRHRDPPTWTPDDEVEDDGAEFPSEGDHYELWIGKIFRAYRRMLSGAAAEQPLLVVLDSFEAVEPADITDWLCPLLLQSVAQDRHEQVRFVLVGTEDELRPVTPEVRSLAGEPMEMRPFDQDHLLRLAREFSARTGLSVPAAKWTDFRRFVGDSRALPACEFGVLVSTLRFFGPGGAP
jgi:CHAT domain